MPPTPHPAKTNSEALLTEREDDGARLSSPDMPVAARARRGVTLIEAVLFISLALGLIVGGLVFYQQASLAARANEQVRLFSSMYTEVQALLRGDQWSPTTEEAWAINNVLVSSGAVSPENSLGDAGDVGGILYEYVFMPEDTPIIKTAWNTGSVWVVEETTTPGTYFVGFVMGDVGVAECSRFLNSVLNGTLQSSVPSDVELISLPFSLASAEYMNASTGYGVDQIAARCGAAGVEGSMIMIMYWNAARF